MKSKVSTKIDENEGREIKRYCQIKNINKAKYTERFNLRTGQRPMISMRDTMSLFRSGSNKLIDFINYRRVTSHGYFMP